MNTKFNLKLPATYALKRYILNHGGLPGLLFMLLGILVHTGSVAQSYCAAGHTAAGCPTYNMYIGEIEILQGGNQIFYKANAQLLSGMNNQWTVDLSNQASGVYVVRALVGHKMYDQKVVITH